MIYGYNDLSLSSQSDIHSSFSRKSCDPLNVSSYSMTSCETSNDSRMDSLSFVDRAVNDIMGTKEGSINQDDNSRVMKFMISCLHDQISTLRAEITYLRTESNIKNSTIDRLFFEISNLRKNDHVPIQPVRSSSFSCDVSDTLDSQTPTEEPQPPDIIHTERPRDERMSIIPIIENNDEEPRNVKDQLKAIRKHFHTEFESGCSSKIPHNCIDVSSGEQQHVSQSNDVDTLAKHKLPELDMKNHTWPKGTVLITGDSILNNLQESRLNKHCNVKVRNFPGADVSDMYHFITPLLRKGPTVISMPQALSIYLLK